MGLQKVKVHTELFQWLNQQTDLTSNQVDLVDGFIFMLKKVKLHQSIRMINEQEVHPRFWKCHDRTFGYGLMSQKKKRKVAHLYQFYVDVSFAEGLVIRKKDRLCLTPLGERYIRKSQEEQLDVLFKYIW
ncbi:hypothetical protein JCM9140_1684 [Halalkalibacter wakoensis JCM 9140]|uniref:Uncharacterized protein n=1 Tax=Halalkalibacter wakoensis JCM 9140 TaxID=1236970 RepID=W4Q121_9BACI|nr:hypothetical protein [Halalkalibacter wakoensis]GAE25677.1 hypothetical protein JCM9140_1684 [Halalkalibacter wakoensis JCM 9140]